MDIARFFKQESKAKLVIAIAIIALVLWLVVDRQNTAAYNSDVDADIALSKRICMAAKPLAAAALRVRKERVSIYLDSNAFGYELPPMKRLSYPRLRKIQNKYEMGGDEMGVYCFFTDPRGKTLHGSADYYYSYGEMAWVSAPVGENYLKF